MINRRQGAGIALACAAVAVAGLWAYRLAAGRLPWQSPAMPAAVGPGDSAPPPVVDRTSPAPSAPDDTPPAPPRLIVVRAAAHSPTFLTRMARQVISFLAGDPSPATRLADRLDRSWRYHLFRADLLMRGGDPASARGHLERVRKLVPDQAAGYVGLAIAAVGANALPTARSLYEKAVALEPENANIVFGLADVCTRLGELRDAEELFRRALRLDADHVAARYGLALIVTAQGHLGEARHLLRQVVEADPTRPGALYYLSQTCFELRQYDEALTYLTAALKHHPDDTDSLNLMGEAYHMTGDLAQALPCLQRAYELAPNDVRILNNLADLHLELHKLNLLEQEHLKMAMLLWRQSLALSPRQQRLIDLLDYYEKLALPPASPASSSPATTPAP